MSKINIKIKRVYDHPTKDDGMRILVDRLWPRGLSKKEAKVYLWLKNIAPSNELRKWFSHDVAKWQEFQKRYANELKNNKENLDKLKQLVKEEATITLLFAATDIEHNNAVVLKRILTQ